MSEKLNELYEQIENLKIPKEDIESIKSNISQCISLQVEECAKALSSVYNENEMTESEVVWIEFDDSQEAVRQAIFMNSTSDD
jgi:hypothetical protein